MILDCAELIPVYAQLQHVSAVKGVLVLWLLDPCAITTLFAFMGLLTLTLTASDLDFLDPFLDLWLFCFFTSLSFQPNL